MNILDACTSSFHSRPIGAGLKLAAFIAWLVVFPLPAAATESLNDADAIVDSSRENLIANEAPERDPLNTQVLPDEQDAFVSEQSEDVPELRMLGQEDPVVEQARILFGDEGGIGELTETDEADAGDPIHASRDFSDESLAESSLEAERQPSSVVSGSSAITLLAGVSNEDRVEFRLPEAQKAPDPGGAPLAGLVVGSRGAEEVSALFQASKLQKKADAVEVQSTPAIRNAKAQALETQVVSSDVGVVTAASNGSLIDPSGFLESPAIGASRVSAAPPLALAPPPPSRSWTGSSSTAWPTASNWSTGSVPGSTEIALFDSNTAEDPSIGKNPTTVGRLDFVPGTDEEEISGSDILTLAGLEGFGIRNSSDLTHSI